MLGETAYVADGKVTGTFTLESEVNTQESLISSIKIALEGKASGGSSSLNLQEKTATPTQTSQEIVADNSYDGLSKVTVEAIPSSYVQPSYSKGATTYTPGTIDQSISSGTYCTGTQTIKGDANLKAENIVSGVSIFGVTGSAETGGGGSSGGSSMVSVTIVVNMDSMDGAYYFDENSMIQKAELGTKTVNALNGIIFTRVPMDTISASGSYTASNIGAVSAVRFLEDGGTAFIAP
jgi:hypothetical protein